uniref:Uncharacterized protein n=1 Tax=viral metagenome TaxID=1070528 RepID=A0A6C0KSV0_9ZZZZ
MNVKIDKDENNFRVVNKKQTPFPRLSTQSVMRSCLFVKKRLFEKTSQNKFFILRTFCFRT